MLLSFWVVYYAVLLGPQNEFDLFTLDKSPLLQHAGVRIGLAFQIPVAIRAERKSKGGKEDSV